MSKKNILRVHIPPIGSNDFAPNIAELTELLPASGFRPLTDATPDTLPVGAIAVIYNCNNHTLFSVMICGHFHGGFSYIPFEQLNDIDPDVDHMSRKFQFKNRLYKVITHLPVVNGKPLSEMLPTAMEEAGFRSLAESSSEDLPEGCVAFLYSANSGLLTPVVVSELSKKFEGDYRFLYWHQSHIRPDNWHRAVIMDSLKPFKNYSYRVV